MDIGIYNSCFPAWDLTKTFSWAAENGFESIEIYAGPRYRHVDWQAIATGKSNVLRELQDTFGIRIVGLMYGRLNFLAADPAERAEANRYFEMLVMAAANSDVPLVSVFTGRNPLETLEQNLETLIKVFPPLLEIAERAGVDVAFENCPMYEFWPPTDNIAVAPVIWRQLFAEIPSPHLGLNFDPSHLVWQRVDILAAVAEFADRIKLVQAKDTEILADVLRDEGMLTLRWWRHRIPGEGLVDWGELIPALQRIGYDGPLSIEHEDPVYSGSDEVVVDGVLRTREHLKRWAS